MVYNIWIINVFGCCICIFDVIKLHACVITLQHISFITIWKYCKERHVITRYTFSGIFNILFINKLLLILLLTLVCFWYNDLRVVTHVVSCALIYESYNKLYATTTLHMYILLSVGSEINDNDWTVSIPDTVLYNCKAHYNYYHNCNYIFAVVLVTMLFPLILPLIIPIIPLSSCPFSSSNIQNRDNFKFSNKCDASVAIIFFLNYVSNYPIYLII